VYHDVLAWSSRFSLGDTQLFQIPLSPEAHIYKIIPFWLKLMVSLMLSSKWN